ncbi:MAG: hypothetical protein P8123_05875 [bacterium]
MLAKAGIGLCAALLITLVLLPEIAVYRMYPARDSGVALYTGWRILDGDVLYRDVWAHKTPLLYYLNALGLLIGRGTTWGVFACEFLALICAISLGFAFMRAEFGVAPALCGTVVWMLSIPLVLEGGNLPEEYALPFQFAALLLFAVAQRRRCSSWPWFLIGITCAAAFLIRPNLVGIWLAVLIVSMIGPCSGDRLHGCVKGIATLFAGVACVASTVAVYFAAKGGLASLWAAVFKYNVAYSLAGVMDRVTAISEGMLLLSRTAIAPMAFCGWICALLWLARSGPRPRPEQPVLKLLVIAFPIEIALAGASGRAYHHYYMAWLPVFAALASFFFLRLIFRWGSFCRRVGVPRARARLLGAVAIFCVLIAGSVCSLRAVAQQIWGADNQRARRQQRESIALVSKMTGDDDYVLIWGAEPSINFLAKRKSPSRFTFQYPLLTRGYQNGAIVKEFISDLERHRPMLIIDTSSSNALIPPLDQVPREKWNSPSSIYGLIPEMDNLFELVGTRYQRIGAVGPLRWSVYARRP